MSEEHFDLFLTGSLAEGSSRELALQQLGKLFKREPEELGKLLAGRPTRVRKNLGSAELKKYQDAFARLGILTEAIPCLDDMRTAIPSAPKPKTTANTAIARHAAAAPAEALALEPVGSPVLRESERHKVAAPNINTGALSLASAGSLLNENNAPKPGISPRTDHLSLAQVGSDLLADKPEQRVPNIDQLSGDFTIAAPGVDLIENPPEKPPAIVPDISHLSTTQTGH
jgi:hypothetical protein